MKKYLLLILFLLIPSFVIGKTIIKSSSGNKVVIDKSDALISMGLIDWWTFDGNKIVNGVVIDSGTGNKNGNPSGIATSTFYVAGKIGQATNYNGSTWYTSVSNSAGLVGNTTAFSMVAWFKTTAASNQSIYMEGNTADNNPLYGITLNSTGTAFVNCRDSAAVTCNSTNSASAYNDGRWHQAVVTQTSKSSRTIYVDGVSVGSNSTAITTVTLNNSTIGARRRVATDFFFNGSIDDVRIYSRALSAQEIVQLYNNGVNIIKSNL